MAEEEEDRRRPEVEEVDSPQVEGGVDCCCYLLSLVDSVVLVPRVERLELQFYKLASRPVLP